MKVVIIGAVAAGTSAGAKIRRNNDMAEITIYEKDRYISYSGCGMPYYIGGEIEAMEELVPRDPVFFKKKYDIDIKTGFEVTSIDRENKTLEVKNLNTGESFKDSYDKLIIATGAFAFRPPIKGVENKNVFFLRNINDVAKIKEFIVNNKPKKAVIAGTGFIGFEVAENLVHQGIDVEIIEIKDKITPNLDRDMASLLENKLIGKGLKIHKSISIDEIKENEVNLSNGTTLPADIVILSTGVKPNVDLAKNAGLEIGVTGAIKVNNRMETSDPNIYSAGDCIETFSTITGKPVYRPLGSTANKTGRIAGDALSGGKLEYKGNLGTGIFKVFDLSVGSTGLSETEAQENGYDIEVVHNIKPDKPEYMGGKEMTIKAVADKKTQRILGVQIVGFEGVDKRIDVFATLITYKATVDELFHLDLAYAPPFSTTKDPVHYTGMILDNALNNERSIITKDKLESLGEVQLIDARSNDDYVNKGTVGEALNIPQDQMRSLCETLDKDKIAVTFCNKGVTGNAAQNILIGRGFKKVYNLSGGHKFFTDSKEK